MPNNMPIQVTVPAGEDEEIVIVLRRHQLSSNRAGETNGTSGAVTQPLDTSSLALFDTFHRSEDF